MTSTGCLIIDDSEPAMSEMTVMGRQVVSESTAIIRSAVLDFAMRRGWTVAPHRAFAAWAADEIAREDSEWLVLDPLMPRSATSGRVRRFRLSRLFHNNDGVILRQWSIMNDAEAEPLSGMRSDVGLLDDATASGGTLTHVSRLVSRAGGNVQHVRLCASSRAAREAFQSSYPKVRFKTFIRGDWNVIHLRDGCPYLPHSGRPSGQPPIIGTDSVEVQVRIPASCVAGSLWQVLHLDARIASAVVNARLEIARRLSAVLGHAARVRDLSLLGPSVPALVAHGESCDGELSLHRLAQTNPSQYAE